VGPEKGILKMADRILTTHVGSLPRPDDLFELLIQEDKGALKDRSELEARVTQAVADVVAKQVECGVDLVSDGEMSKIAYTFYVKHRLSGMEDKPRNTDAREKALVSADLVDHPDWNELLNSRRGMWTDMFARPCCTGPVAWRDSAPLERDIANLKAAAAASKPVGCFMNSGSPAVLTKFVPDHYYNSEDAYIGALSDAMKVEYEAIVDAGFSLQIDCPDLGSARHNQYQAKTDAEFLKIADRNVEALNAATANIPPEKMRLHICWGNYEGPHTHDIPLATIFPALAKARPSVLLFEAANPRHEHEWEELKDVKIPDDKILVPGVIDSTTNFVEHPKLIAQRLCNWAGLVGYERVIAGSDCGFGTFAMKRPQVAHSVVWTKFRAMAEGAAMATDRMKGRVTA
jgi:5-methyltetrahydropteroyltriglutamate--homocysteine methyltransferase